MALSPIVLLVKLLKATQTAKKAKEGLEKFSPESIFETLKAELPGNLVGALGGKPRAKSDGAGVQPVLQGAEDTVPETEGSQPSLLRRAGSKANQLLFGGNLDPSLGLVNLSIDPKKRSLAFGAIRPSPQDVASLSSGQATRQGLTQATPGQQLTAATGLLRQDPASAIQQQFALGQIKDPNERAAVAEGLAETRVNNTIQLLSQLNQAIKGQTGGQDIRTRLEAPGRNIAAKVRELTKLNKEQQQKRLEQDVEQGSLDLKTARLISKRLRIK